MSVNGTSRGPSGPDRAPLLPTPELLQGASSALQEATRAHYAAVREHAAAKLIVETARARLLLEGVEGKNAEAREAHLRLALEPEYDAAERASVRVNETRADLECARVAWDCLRYTVRAAALETDVPF